MIIFKQNWYFFKGIRICKGLICTFPFIEIPSLVAVNYYLFWCYNQSFFVNGNSPESDFLLSGICIFTPRRDQNRPVSDFHPSWTWKYRFLLVEIAMSYSNQLNNQLIQFTPLSTMSSDCTGCFDTLRPFQQQNWARLWPKSQYFHVPISIPDFHVIF